MKKKNSSSITNDKFHCSIPQKRQVTVPNSKHLQTANSNECRICRETGGKGFALAVATKTSEVGGKVTIIGCISGALAHIIKSWKIWQMFHMFVQYMDKRNRKVNRKKNVICFPSFFFYHVIFYVHCKYIL